MRCQLLTLPVRFGGLDLKNLVKTADVSYKTSRDATLHLVKAIGGQVMNFVPRLHVEQVLSVKANHVIGRDRFHQDIFSELMSGFDRTHQRIFERAKDSLLA